jgi:hypothetical protein
MLILCSECGHRLRAEAGSIGAFGMLDFFDARTASDTFGERVARCPGCDLWLYYGLGIEPSDLAQQPG